MEKTIPLDPGASAAPVFLLGFQRSGTTLLRLLLDAHSELAIPFESFVLIDFYERRHEYGDLTTLEQRSRLVGALLSAKGINAWEPRVESADVNLERCGGLAATIDQIFSAYARKSGKSLWGDKTPSYTGHLDVLNELFPRAKFVHLLRDGRDCALSLVRQPWGPQDLLTALQQWNEIVGWSRKMGRMLPPGRYLEVRFEDLTSDPEQVLRRITQFLGLEFEPAMLRREAQLDAKLPARSMAFHGNLRRPVDDRLALEWRGKLSPADQVLSLKIAGGLLMALGYPVEHPEIGATRLQGRRFWHWLTSAARWRLRRLRRRRQKTLGQRADGTIPVVEVA